MQKFRAARKFAIKNHQTTLHRGFPKLWGGDTVSLLGVWPEVNIVNFTMSIADPKRKSPVLSGRRKTASSPLCAFDQAGMYPGGREIKSVPCDLITRPGTVVGSLGAAPQLDLFLVSHW